MNKLDIQKLICELKKHNLYLNDNVSDNIHIDNLSYNSKCVTSSTLFICKGIYFKESYLTSAISSGAPVYMSEVEYISDTPHIIVSDVRKALSVLAMVFYNYHNRDLVNIGVTGTKGKSSTIFFMNSIFKSANQLTAFTTTIDIFNGVNTVESVLTTPESLELHEIIHQSKLNGCKNLLMELSSQAYKMDRIYGLDFRYGIFVNIAPDHISPNEHKDFDEYLACKLEIVKKYETAIINKDDEHFSTVYEIAKKYCKTVYTYSLEDSSADAYCSDFVLDGFKTYYNMHILGHCICTEINMPGMYNISNALSAAFVAHLQDINDNDIINGIKSTTIPGRMNIYEKNGCTAIVDYAHNESSLRALLKSIKLYYPKKNIHLVFGCPGGKALQRRYDMANASNDGAKYVYITSEDPSKEDPLLISQQIKGYLDSFNIENCIIIDRKEAIDTAIKNMSNNDIVIVAGKGSEHYQIIQGETVDYESDTVLCDKFLNIYK